MENIEDHIPTAEETLKLAYKNTVVFPLEGIMKVQGATLRCVIEAMNNFAKMHVEAALEAARDKARLVGVPVHNDRLPNETDVEYVYEHNDNTDDYMYSIDGYTIINAYPLTNIE